MKWFLNISTRNKLLAGFFLIIILLTAVLLTAYKAITDINSNQKILLETEFPMSLAVANLRADTNRERTLMSRAIAFEGPASVEPLLKELKEINDDIKEGFQQLHAISARSPQYSPFVKELDGMRENYISVWEKELIPLLLKRSIREAGRLFTGPHRELYEKMREANLRLSLMTEENNKDLRTGAEKIVAESKNMLIGVSIIAVLAGIIMSILLTAIIAEPLRKASAAAEQIAYGDLTVKLPSLERRDEVGSLVLAMGMMTESLRTVTGEIQTAVNSLAASSGEMLKGFDEGIKSEDGISRMKDMVQDLNSLGLRLKKLVEQYKL